MRKEELQKYKTLVDERKWLELRMSTFKKLPNAPELAELLARYEALLSDLAAEQLAIEQAIESLEPTARMLMRYRYIDGRKWEEICLLMSYSWRQVHRLHAAALEELRGEQNGQKYDDRRVPHPADR